LENIAIYDKWINPRRQLKASSSTNDVDYTRGTMKKPNQIVSMLVIGFIAVIYGCSTPSSTVLPAEAMRHTVFNPGMRWTSSSFTIPS
jgi:hypothetical protein